MLPQMGSGGYRPVEADVRYGNGRVQTKLFDFGGTFW
jgi:hypothetical protein